METPRRLTDALSVLGQIEPADIARLAESGFRVLIDNRPDSEVDAAHDSNAMRKAAEAAGMTFFYIPYAQGQAIEPTVAEQAAALARPGPALAYCRSGMRSTTLWALASADRQPADAIIAAAAAVGYDIRLLGPALRARG